MIAFDRRGSETRQKNGTFKSIEELRQPGAFPVPRSPLRPFAGV